MLLLLIQIYQLQFHQLLLLQSPMLFMSQPHNMFHHHQLSSFQLDGTVQLLSQFHGPMEFLQHKLLLSHPIQLLLLLTMKMFHHMFQHMLLLQSQQQMLLQSQLFHGFKYQFQLLLFQQVSQAQLLSHQIGFHHSQQLNSLPFHHNQMLLSLLHQTSQHSYQAP